MDWILVLHGLVVDVGDSRLVGWSVGRYREISQFEMQNLNRTFIMNSKQSLQVRQPSTKMEWKKGYSFVSFRGRASSVTKNLKLYDQNEHLNF